MRIPSLPSPPCRRPWALLERPVLWAATDETLPYESFKKLMELLGSRILRKPRASSAHACAQDVPARKRDIWMDGWMGAREEGMEGGRKGGRKGRLKGRAWGLEMRASSWFRDNYTLPWDLSWTCPDWSTIRWLVTQTTGFNWCRRPLVAKGPGEEVQVVLGSTNGMDTWGTLRFSRAHLQNLW